MINIRDFDQPVILKEACEQYNIAPKKATLIRAYSNLIYDCGDSILRLTHPQDRNAEEVKLELDWVQYLHENDVDVATYLIVGSLCLCTNSILNEIRSKK